MLDKMFLQVLNMSFTVSIVVLFVLVARLLLKNAPKNFSYALWSVVLFRLICPYSFESIFSLLPTAVIKKMGNGVKKEYSSSLLSLTVGKRIVGGIPLAFGEGDTKGRIKNVLDYKKPTLWIIIVALITVLAICIGLAANPQNNHKSQGSIATNLLKHRTEYIGDNSKVGAIINALEYPDKVKYSSFELYTDSPPLSVTINLDTDTEARNFYTGALNEGPFRRNAIMMFSLIHNAEYITFVLNDGTNPYSIQFTRDAADSFVDGDVWSYSTSPEQFETLLQMIESIQVTEPEQWNPQQEIENQDDYFEALEAARQSDKTEEIAVNDKGSNEKTALAWMDAWFDMYKVLPKDNMAHISEGVVDDLDILKVSKERLPKSFVFSVTFSVRPTYFIAHNAFWIAGNTGNSPGRDKTWGQMYREVELRMGDDGRYYFAEMGTGAVGHSKNYDSVNADYTSIRFYITSAETAVMTFAREVYGNFPLRSSRGMKSTILD